MPAIMKPLSARDLLKPAGQVGIQLDGEKTVTPFGHATLTFKKSSTKSEIRTPESPGREIIGTDYSELTGMVDIEFANLNRLGMALAFMAKLKSFEQAAVAERTINLGAVQLNQWIELRASSAANALSVVNTTVTAVTAGGAALDLNTHYKHDAKGGLVQIIALPDGTAADASIAVTFTAAKVDASPTRGSALLLQELVVRGRLILRQNNLRGVNRKLIIPQIAFGGESGDVQLIQDGTDIVKVTASGTIEADYSQPEGYENGYTIDLV